MKADDVRRQIQALLKTGLPTLGDSAKVYAVELTEPEINALHAGAAFIKAVCADWPDPIAALYWNHYGPTLQHLSERLMIFNDVQPDATPDPTAGTTHRDVT